MRGKEGEDRNRKEKTEKREDRIKTGNRRERNEKTGERREGIQ